MGRRGVLSKAGAINVQATVGVTHSFRLTLH